MTQASVLGRQVRTAVAVALSSSMMLTDVALASQGPGSGMGTASHLTQMLVAVAVYGTSGLIVAAGLLGAIRGRARNQNAKAL